MADPLKLKGDRGLKASMYSFTPAPFMDAIVLDA